MLEYGFMVGEKKWYIMDKRACISRLFLIDDSVIFLLRQIRKNSLTFLKMYTVHKFYKKKKNESMNNPDRLFQPR